MRSPWLVATAPLGARAVVRSTRTSGYRRPVPPATDATTTAERPGAVDVEVSPSRARSRRRAPLVDAAGVAATTGGLLVITLRLWEANLRVPFVYNATDRPPLAYAPAAPYYRMPTKALVDHGTDLAIPNLGRE